MSNFNIPVDAIDVARTERASKRASSKAIVENNALAAAADYDLLVTLVGFWVRRAHVKVLRSFERHLGPYQLTPTEVATLIIVGANDDLSQIQLASALSADQSTVVNLLVGLEQRGMLSRVRLAKDRRYQILSLTQMGRKALKRIKTALAQHNESVQAALSADERKALLALLRRLVQE